MGVPPVLGRTFGDDSDPILVISDRLRRKLFGADGEVLGQSLRLTDREIVERTYTIVGVMPPEFQYPRASTDVWRPLGFVRSTGDGFVRERRGGWEFIARLKDGVSVEAARPDAGRANDVVKPQFIGGRVDMHAKITPLVDYISGTIGPALWILLGAVGLVLLVACSNVANLILARQSVRSREISMRMALGAPRGRLVAYMLAESGIVAAIGGITGIAIAFGFIRLLKYLRPAQLPRLDAIEVDLPILIFAILVAAAASIIAGVGPAILATRTDAVLAMRAGNRGAVSGASRRARSVLVVAEIAASIVLLVGAALLSRSLAAMIGTNLGVNTENVTAALVDLSLGRVTSPARQLEIMESLRQRIAALPSVSSTGYGVGLPPAGEYLRISFVLNNGANAETQSHIVTSVPASPGYFSTLQIPLLSGRFFSDADGETAPPVGILSREAAKRFYGTPDPVGRILPFGKGGITIVGVVENVKYTGIVSPMDGVVYRPYAQNPFRLSTLVARTSGDPSRIANEIRQVVRSYDPGISIANVQPLTTWVSDSVAQPRFRALLLGSIAGIALILAVIGLYGVIAYSTSQRTSEIGVRIAIGAQRSDVIRMVVAEGTRLAIIGIGFGLIGAYWAAKLLSTFLYGVTATDLPAFAGAGVVLFLVALAATYLPARRASRVDPMIALRVE
jgi:putative ABC transport system permease protein